MVGGFGSRVVVEGLVGVKGCDAAGKGRTYAGLCTKCAVRLCGCVVGKMGDLGRGKGLSSYQC